MTINTETTSRTKHLLALMTRGDDLFNARDWQTLDDVHHPDMTAFRPRVPSSITVRRSEKPHYLRVQLRSLIVPAQMPKNAQ